MTGQRLCLIGFGGVGKELCRILANRDGVYPSLSDLELSVVGILTRSHGALVDSDGIDLRMALSFYDSHGRFTDDCEGYAEITGLDAVGGLDYDVLVELSTLDIVSGGEPAVSFCRLALQKGRSVVTANKGPIAFHYRELNELSTREGGSLCYESTVMDGAPVFRMARSCLKGARIRWVEGILNSTSNFILTEMEKGQSLEGALGKARARGFVEADPTLDLEGWDAAAKICVIANTLLDASLTPVAVEREGITSVDPARVSSACARQKHLKQVASVSGWGDSCRARVRLEEVSREDVLANVRGAGGALRIHTDLMGPIVILQEDPGLSDTAFGVLNDLLSIVDPAGPKPALFPERRTRAQDSRVRIHRVSRGKKE